MLNKEKNSFSILFAAIVCVVAAGLLSFASTKLRPLQEANAKLDKQKNVLVALKVGRDGERYGTEHVKAFYADTADQATVQKLYETYVRPGVVDLATGDLVEGADPEALAPGQAPIWTLVKDGKVEAVAIDAIGKGLWSTLYGFLALESDFNTVRGITFYSHGETAGLGARIEEGWFQDGFVGKKIFDENGKLVSVSVAKGVTAKGDHEVDGISGATLTCKGVTGLLANELNAYGKWIERNREGAAAPAEAPADEAEAPAAEGAAADGANQAVERPAAEEPAAEAPAENAEPAAEGAQE